MRKKGILLSERNLMFAIGGQLFSQAPNSQPRKAEIIMNKVRDAFRKDARNDNEYYTLVLEEGSLYTYIHDLLFNIPDFQELNLSQVEFDNNVSVDDENRAEFKFTSAYDKETTESWKTDFIDLDAFTRNAVRNIYMETESDTDCFCCVHNNDKDTVICEACTVNPNYSINYKGCRTPKGKYTFACEFDCYRSSYICCEECDKKNSCDKKCDSESKSCGLAINRIEPKTDDIKRGTRRDTIVLNLNKKYGIKIKK